MKALAIRAAGRSPPGAWATQGAENRVWPGILIGDPAAPAVADFKRPFRYPASGFVPGQPAAIDFYIQGVIGALLYGDPRLDMNAIDFVRADLDLRAKLAPIINADNPDLRPARQSARKILQFHGWADPNIAPQFSIDYFEAVRKLLGGDTGDFYRLFMVPGMAHCSGGIGPVNVGGVDPTEAGVPIPSLIGNPESDWTSALQRWVEQGVAPERILATEFDLTSGAPPRARATRPLCPYPRVAVYSGTGSTDDAANFQCAELAPVSRTGGPR